MTDSPSDNHASAFGQWRENQNDEGDQVIPRHIQKPNIEFWRGHCEVLGELLNTIQDRQCYFSSDSVVRLNI